jgi:hypothetical protein
VLGCTSDIDLTWSLTQLMSPDSEVLVLKQEHDLMRSTDTLSGSRIYYHLYHRHR